MVRNLGKVLLPSRDKSPYVIALSNDFKIKINPKEDRGVEASLYYYGQYELGTLDFITRTLDEGSVFIDIGANIGLMSLYASKKIGPKGKIYAFEAFPDTANELEGNLKLNDIENVTLYREALGDFNGTTEIYTSSNKNKGMTSLVKTEKHELSELKIPVKMLNEYTAIGLEKIAVVKVDVEGFEYQVLEGANKIFQGSYKPVLVVEYDEKLNGTDEKHLFDLIMSFGDYEVYISKYSKERLSPFKEVKNKKQLPSHENLFCIPKSRKEELISKGIELV